MIIDKCITIKISTSNKKHFLSLNYCDIKIGDELIVLVSELKTGSEIKIKVKCDICGNEKYLKYRTYLKSLKNHNIYACSTKCSSIKNKKTKLEKYGSENYYNIEKYKNTCIKKYGVEFGLQSDKIKEKTKRTKLEKYGDENYNNIDKNRKTKLEKHGDENYNNRIKFKETNIKLYGVEYYPNVEKYKKTFYEKYGCENPQQDLNIFTKTQKSSCLLKRYKNLYYRGTYEFDFLENFYDKLQIENGKSIKYEYENKQKTYHPDFYLPDYNLIIEIKSDYTYNKDLNKNLEKQKACLQQGYNFIFIINKNYNDFIESYFV